MRLELANKSGLEEALFRFLLTVREGKPWAANPLLAESGVINDLFAGLNPGLTKALQHCLDSVIVEITPDPAEWEAVMVPAPALALAIAANNCIALIGATESDRKDGRTDVVLNFTRALIDLIPPARDIGLALTYHAILRGAVASFPVLKPQQRQLLFDLIECSTITAMRTLDIYAPAALHPIAAELLPRWGASAGPARAKVEGADDWLDAAVVLLSDPLIARWMRHHWIALPETHAACLNLGLLLEALRRRDQRDLILEFYESYEFFCARATPEGGPGQGARAWPVIETIRKLLCVSGDDEAAIQMNRRGNEYFVKFRPLLEIVIAERGVPTDYRVSTGFVLAIRPLVNYTTESVRQRVSLSKVTFND